MNKKKTVSVFLSRPSLWIGLFVILGVVFLAFTVNFQRPEQAGAAAQVYGQGTPRFLAKWVTPTPPPVADIKANGSDGPLPVASGEIFTVTWCGSPAAPCANANSCTVTFSDGPGGWTSLSGTQPQNLTASRIYTLTCSGVGPSAVDSVAVNVSGTPPAADIKAKDPADGVFKDGTITIPSGTATDLKWDSVGADACFTPGGNNGDLTGPSWVVGQSGSGGALRFDGFDDYVNVPHNTSQLLKNGFTISAWINPTNAGEGGFGRIIDKSNSTTGGGGFVLYMTTNNLRGTINGGTIRSSALGSIPFGAWSHVAMTANSSGLITFYVNGAPSGTPGNSSLPSGITTVNPLRIGQRSNATDRTFNGSVDEVRIYNRVLSLAEIQNDRDNIALPGTAVPPIAYWKFNEGLGTTANDSAGYPGTWANPIATNGGPSTTGNLTSARTYLFTCSNAFGVTSDSVTVDIGVVPLGDFTLSSGAVQCNSIGLNWAPGSAGADGYRIFKSISGGPFSQIGTTAATFYPDGGVVQSTPYSYYIKAYRGADTKNSNTISISTPPCPPTVDLKCNGQNGPISGVASGYTCDLTWTSTDTSGPTPCTASGGFWSGPGPRAASNAVGESSLPITDPTTFTMTCTGPGSPPSAVDSVDVTPGGLPLPGWIEIIPK